MKKSFVFAAFLSLFVLATAASAQKGADFSGKWTLDVAKSKLGDRNRIESQTMTVTQTATEIKIETASKMAAPAGGAGGGAPMGAPAGGPPPGGGGGRPGGGGFGGGGGGGSQTTTYMLGKESKMDQPGQGGTTIPVTLSSKIDGSNLWLTRSSTFAGQNGDVTNVTKDSWSLGPDGKSLTVNREATRNGNTTSTTMVYSKN